MTGILKSVKHFRDEFGESLTTVWVQLGDDAGVVKFTVPSILATDE
ncbi:hypothetical protein [Rhodococcus sp. (in: high G+C Gram-positive bacteria)]|nr:hypothetical protein [Rhodococcus sp. (in: high G+C Gram-positive bacteria)]